MARCLGIGMQQDDESSHSHDITTTGGKTHGGEAESTPQAGSLFLFSDHYCARPIQ